MGNIVPSLSEPCPPSRQVNTKYGPIIGRRLIHKGDRLVDAFQGIPFATPPLGELRFNRPKPPESWTEVRETKSFGARSIQKDLIPFSRMKLGPTSEDCLTLNVFTPCWEPEQPSGFPVLVYIHGGGFVMDSCVKYGDIGICKNIVTKDMVVVTTQYRLGYLGFFTTGDDVCPGNNALWDMKMALEWVHDNIRNFNGDPTNITIMGQSAGGDFVDLLSLSPHTRDLFHKVIPMAGNASAEWSICKNASETCRKFAAKHGVSNYYDSEKFLEDLRKVPAHTFGLTIEVLDEWIPPVGPRIDGHFLPKPLDELRKEAPIKPRMIGCCRSEGVFFLLTAAHIGLNRLEDVAGQLITEKDFPNDFKQKRKAYMDRIVSMDKRENLTAEEVRRAVGEGIGDRFLNIACQKAVCEWLKHGSPVYFYSYDYFNPKMWGMVGLRMPYKDSTHCTEIAYLFAVGLISSFEYTEEDLQMLDYTTRLWTNFCKYGDPNGKDEAEWLPATLEHPQRHFQIDLQSTMSDVYKNGRPMLILDFEKEKTSSQP
ncbi:unnamed protein product [Auanema sp. JU1783]|nr:unnamed protein product [Auanema sp. JU1783]